jgi:hypothetical protein
METRKQGSVVFNAVLFLVGTLIIIQLWLVAAGLDAHLRGSRRIPVAAAVASLTLLGLNSGLLGYVLRINRRVRKSGGCD